MGMFCKHECLRSGFTSNTNSVKFRCDVDLLAKATEGFTGADLCNLCNKAGLNALSHKVNLPVIA